MKFSKIWKHYKFPLILLFSIIVGCIIGIIFEDSATVLKPVGTIFINLLFTIVVPLVFFTISSSIANMVDLRRLGKIFKYMFIIFILTSLISSLFMLISTLMVNPVGNSSILLESGSKEAIDISSKIVSMLTVSNFYELFTKDHILPLIIFAMLFGFSVSMMKEKGSELSKILNIISDACNNLIKLVMYIAPIGLCAYFAALIGEYGKEIIGSYAKSMILYYVVAILYYIIFYTLYSYIAGKKKGVKRFYKNIFTPTVTSLGTCSSLASLPSNISSSEKIGIPKDIREVTLPIGSTMHMEGSSMAAILKIVFLFGIFGKSFTGIDTYLIAILIAVLSGVVMSGIPGGGLIGEMLIVSLYGFPLEAFPIIATIGWLVDPIATSLNVVGDTASTMMITNCIEGKKWIERNSQ